MKNKIQLTIPEPCHEGWHNMDVVEKGRFCNSCQKQVVDFTNMSDSQVLAFFRKPSTGSVCGRFMNDQLNRELLVPRKRIPWVKYFFQVALPAFLVSAKASAQGKVKIDTVVQASNQALAVGMVLPKPSKEPVERKISGRVIDQSGAPLTNVSIMVKGTRFGTITDDKGIFKLQSSTAPKIVIQASSVGFETIDFVIENDKISDTLVLQMKPMINALEGEVVIVGNIRPKKAKKIPLIPQKLMDTAARFFRIFPNPVSSGNSLNIELTRKLKEGYYLVELLNYSGNSVYRQQIWIDSEARVMNMEIPSLSEGHYIVRLAEKETGKIYTEKLLIQ